MIFLEFSTRVNSVKHGMKNEKLEWADSVMFVISRKYGFYVTIIVRRLMNQLVSALPLLSMFNKTNNSDDCSTFMRTKNEIDGRNFRNNGTFETKFEMAVIHREDMIEVSDIIYFDRETDICIFTVTEMIGRELKISKRI